MKSMPSTIRLALMAGCAVVAMAPAIATAQEQALVAFDIPAQDLDSALTRFGQQSGREIIISADLTRNRRGGAVQGRLAPEDALRLLLADSGLHYRVADTGSIIVEASDPQSGSAAGDGADGTVQALVVTAQKREENIQDVPIAISAFTQEDLTRSQVAGGPDLMTQVPNFTFTKTNFSGYSIQIRGIGTQAISATTDPAVAVAFNNTPFIRNRFFEQEFYDLERIEVLRGPQGTLYGRNATAGVVNIISAKPKFRYDSRLSLDAGNYNSTRLEGMVNIPLVDDKVAVRLAGAWTKRDGYDTNQITGNQIDGRDLWSTRLSLRFTPTDRIDANLVWEHFKEDDDRLRSGKQLCHKDVVTEVGGVSLPDVWTGLGSPQGFLSQGCKPASLYSPDSFETPNGFALPYYQPLSILDVPTVEGLDPYLSTTQSRDLRVIESTVDPAYSADTDTVVLDFDFDISPSLALTSETGYLSDTISSVEDYNRFNTTPHAFSVSRYLGSGTARPGVLDSDGFFCDPQIGCADRLVAMDMSTAKSRQFSQEFRVSSSFDGPFNFSLGANFLRYDTEDKYYVFVNTLTMYAALAATAHSSANSPYVGDVSDNYECLPQGLAVPDLSRAYDVAGCIYIDPNPIGNLNDSGHNYFLSRNPYKLISYAAFGEAYYKISDNVKLTAGLRWTVDKKEAPRIPSWILAASNGGNISGGGYSTSEVIEQEWREPTGRVALDWKPSLSFTDETLIYGSFARGYKAGGANPPPPGLVLYATFDKQNFISGSLADSAAHPKTFGPEFVNAFEIGTKNTLQDGRIKFNLDGFYYDYTGYQISEIVDRSALNLNFDAKVWGVELESSWRPKENIQLGLKVGYENTRVADGASEIDLMDRTAGHLGPDGKPDWVVVRPFPTLPSNCILPVSVIDKGGTIEIPGQPQGGNLSGCELAYVENVDPLTGLTYVADPTVTAPGFSVYPGYKGFDPSTAPNGGAGFSKDLSGHALPNAPHFTATLTGDYTVPLPSDWLMTLHSDLYYQSEAWTRIFNTPGYDKLKAYTNVNLAAIFTNEAAGWNIMAYVKNVFDRDSITGAFLNSDDTGLTTNVFLTEPRLYGLRVTKEWTGGPWWTGANPNHPAGEPYPLTIEIGGGVERQDAPYQTISPDSLPSFPSEVDPTSAQHRDFDWGDSREVGVTYRPKGSAWSVSANFRNGKANTSTREHGEAVVGPRSCIVPITTYIGKLRCDPTYIIPGYEYLGPGAYYTPGALRTPIDWADTSVVSKEEHLLADFSVGRDVGIGVLGSSVLSLGLRYAELKSNTDYSLHGVPDSVIPEGWAINPFTHSLDQTALTTSREFKGEGPILGWSAATKLARTDGAGHLDLDWALSAGVLFGRQTTDTRGTAEARFYSQIYNSSTLLDVQQPDVAVGQRSQSVSVPVVDLSLGLSYEIQRVKVGAGYHWERYFNVLDAGYTDRQQYDRTFDGPYFKIAVGFGG